MGAVETLIVWENLEINRLTLRNNTTQEEKVLHLTAEQERNESHFRDPETGSELEVIDKVCNELLCNCYMCNCLYSVQLFCKHCAVCILYNA